MYNWVRKEGKSVKSKQGFENIILQLNTFYSDIHNKKRLYSRERSKVYTAFIDYQIAFDTVDKVWETLHNLET